MPVAVPIHVVFILLGAVQVLGGPVFSLGIHVDENLATKVVLICSTRRVGDEEIGKWSC